MSLSGMDASSVVQMCVDLAALGNVEGLLDIVPDSVVDEAIKWKQRTSRFMSPKHLEGGEEITFLELALMSAQLDFFVGAHALRALVFSRPSCCQLLSSMQLAPGQFVQRCAVTAASGEEMVLAFRLCLEERHQPSYRGFTTGQCWVLRSIKGEPAVEDEQWPSRPDPVWGPEAVVCGQLEALRDRDVERALGFAALSGLDRSMLHVPAYAPLMHHRGYDIVATAQASASQAIVFAGVHVGGGGLDAHKEAKQCHTIMPYLWSLSLHRNGTTWLVDAVQPFAMY